MVMMNEKGVVCDYSRQAPPRSTTTITATPTWCLHTVLENSSAMRRLRRQTAQSKLPAHLLVTTGVDMLTSEQC